jgi:hypothetical protein
MDNGEIDLFKQSVAGEYDDDLPWAAGRKLQWLGTREVFDRAADWCKSEDLRKRARGADVLAQPGKAAEYRSNTFPDESFVVASRLLQKETEVRPTGLCYHDWAPQPLFCCSVDLFLLLSVPFLTRTTNSNEFEFDLVRNCRGRQMSSSDCVFTIDGADDKHERVTCSC